MQTQLTNSQVQVQIAENQGEADLARARKQAEQTGRRPAAGRRAEQTASWPAERRRAARQCSAGRPVRGVGAAPQDRSRSATRGCTPCRWSPSTWPHSSQPLVPERVFMAPGSRRGQTAAARARRRGLLGMLISLLVAEKSGFDLAAPARRRRASRSSPTRSPSRPWRTSRPPWPPTPPKPRSGPSPSSRPPNGRTVETV